jgi:hypothetical protein
LPYLTKTLSVRKLEERRPGGKQAIGGNSSEKDWDSAAAIKKNKNIACLPHHNEIALIN